MGLRNFDKDARAVLKYLQEFQNNNNFTDVNSLLTSMTDFEVGTFMEIAVRRGLLEQGTQVPTVTDLNMSSLVRMGPNGHDFLIDQESQS